MTKRIISSLVALTLLAGLGLVGGSCTEAVQAKTGTIEVRVTDAPPGYEIISIMVTVSEVKVHKAGDGEDGGWTTNLAIVENTFDLRDLDGSELTLAIGEVEIGTYTQLRMTIVGVEVTYSYLEDGEESPTTVAIEATIPSGELKFVRPFEVVEDGTVTLVIDFDADKSVVVTEAGEDGKVIFKPVVKLSIEPEE